LQAYQSPLSQESVRDAYFLGQHNDQSTLSFFSQYVQTLPPPDSGAYVSEVEIYTPYTQVIEASRRRSGSYSAQQAELDYRHRSDKLFVRVRVLFTETYGVELYRSAKGDKELSGRDLPLPDFYRDFRVGLSQRVNPDREARTSENGTAPEDQWVEPLRIVLQPAYTANSNHFAFIPEDLGMISFLGSFGGAAYGHKSGSHFVHPTGWQVWLVYDANDVASDDATVEVITTDGQDVRVPFDLSRLR
jgi:hypothetical protein